MKKGVKSCLFNLIIAFAGFGLGVLIRILIETLTR